MRKAAHILYHYPTLSCKQLIKNKNRKDKKYNGKITSGEIGLPMANSKLVLPCGIYGRWEN